ncbi:MAG TPA: malate synthase A [Gemmatimonadales bacterium]|jgi:malate synthase|nr:malate synthase A [Gemmatimonadales bacterium]
MPNRVTVAGPPLPESSRVLTPDALAFLAELESRFAARRHRLLADREARRRAYRSGHLPDFPAETREVREGEWRVGPAPRDLDDRRVEITGPAERKMMINALNSGANVFMADFEDALSPTWENVIRGQANCMDAVRRTLSFRAPEGKEYTLGPSLATLVVRPRGWHLSERHLTLDGEPLSAGLVDFGLYLFHNARELLARGSGPYFYLPKLEGRHEAQLWEDIFIVAQEAVGIPRGTIRATLLVETLPAAFEMDEMLFVLREHAAGLNAGRWDYIFSVIKNLGHRPDFLLPDRSQVTMTVPFMRAYTELLVRTCHRRGAHAIGGMAAFIPSRRDPELNARALARVREDKRREAEAGFDGAWVAHPDLVPVVREVFDQVLGERPHQKHRLREDVHVTARDLLDVRVPGGRVTETGVRTNIRVALEYIEQWLEGRGAVAIDNLMEDAATAEISRAQLRQWLDNRVALSPGRPFTEERYREFRQEELARLQANRPELRRLADAAELLDQLVLGDLPEEFLTLPAYERLGERR